MNKAAHMMNGSDKSCHVTPLLKELHWLPIELRKNFKMMCLTYKILNRLALEYLTEQITHYSPTRSLHSSERDLLIVPKVHQQTFDARATWLFIFSWPPEALW